jgi:hypothetical protein
VRPDLLHNQVLVMSKLTELESAIVKLSVEEFRSQIESTTARPEIDYTQDAEDVMLIQYCLALGMQDLLKREAVYVNGGGWCLGRIHADIARCHKLQDKYSCCFETVMRDVLQPRDRKGRFLPWQEP